MTRREILNNHPYEIFTTNKKGGIVYRTYIEDANNDYKRKLIERKNLLDLENEIVRLYKSVKTFENVLNEWRVFYKATVKITTFDRTNSDIERFFFNKDIKVPFFKKEIDKIKRIDLKNFYKT